MNDDERFVVISTPASEVERMLVESLLSDAGISYSLRNVDVQNLFGAGQIGGSNIITGPVQVIVAESDAELALDIMENRSEMERDAGSELSACPACNAEIKGEHECPECGLVLVPAGRSSSGISGCSSGEEILPGKLYQTYSKYSLVWGILWIWGIGSLISIYYGIKALKIRSIIPEGERPGILRPVLGLSLGIFGLLLWSTLILPGL